MMSEASQAHRCTAKKRFSHEMTHKAMIVRDEGKEVIGPRVLGANRLITSCTRC